VTIDASADLSTSQQYILFFSTSGLQSGQSGKSLFGYLGTNYQGVDGNSGGNYVYLDSGDDASEFTTPAWSNPNSCGGNAGADVTFKATFLPNAGAPESSTSAAFAFTSHFAAGLMLHARKLHAA
jgi:hypothetical protein